MTSLGHKPRRDKEEEDPCPKSVNRSSPFPSTRTAPMHVCERPTLTDAIATLPYSTMQGKIPSHLIGRSVRSYSSYKQLNNFIIGVGVIHSVALTLG